MGRDECTAINNLIHVAQGRVIQRTAPSGVRGAPAPIPSLVNARPALPPPLPRTHAAGSNTAPLSDARVAEMPAWGAEPDDQEDEMTVRVDPEMRQQMLAAALQKDLARETARKAAAQPQAHAYAAPAPAYPPQHAQVPHPYYAQHPEYAHAYGYNAGMYGAYGHRPLSLGQRLQHAIARHTIAIGAVAIVLAVAITYAAFGSTSASATATTAQGAVSPTPAVAALESPVKAEPATPASAPAPAMAAVAPAPAVTPTATPIVEPIVEAAPPAPTPAVAAEPAPAPTEVAAAAPAAERAEEPADEIAQEAVAEVAPAPAKKATKKSSRARARARSARVAREREVARSERRASRSKREIESDPVLAAIHGESSSKKKSKSGVGRVLIKANVDATVYVDGRRTDTTVPGAISLPAGKHQITLMDPETRKAKTTDLEIEPGETYKINRKF